MSTELMDKTMTYEVFVANIGTVYSGDDLCDAQYEFDTYVDLSKRGIGRAGGQDVILFVNGHVGEEYHGTASV
jgi:hypothetical protein